MLYSFSSNAAYAPGHSGGHGGGHGHSSGHAHIGHSCGHSHSSWTYHSHYHSSYHHRSGDHYYAANTGNRYNHSAVYRNPLLGEHELSIGIGSAAANQLPDSAATFASPTGFFTYRYYVSNGVSLGFTAGIQQMRGASIYENAGYQMMPFTYSQMNTTLAAEMTFLYCSRGLFQAYGMLGLGVLHWSEEDLDQDGNVSEESGNKLAYQVTPLGIRVGRSLGVFGELGYGYKGIVFGGLSYQAGWHRAHPRNNRMAY